MLAEAGAEKRAEGDQTQSANQQEPADALSA